MKIAILGDSHDHYENLQKAVNTANEHGCELMLHTGDLGAPKNSINILQQFTGQIKMIIGNNDHEIVGIMRKSFELDNFELIKSARGGDSYEDAIDSVRIFMHHYPRIAELAAASGEFDLCIHGHTHEYRQEMVGQTMLLNPSAILAEKEPPSIAIYDTETRSANRLVLE
jgi:putative phosphoesterase